MEFEIKGVKYRTAKLSVFEQLKVSRKLLPVLAGMVSDFRSVQEKISSKDTEGAMATILPKIANAVSDLSDGDMAFDDIDLLTMLQLVARVVADSLGNFLQGLPTSETPTPPAE